METHHAIWKAETPGFPIARRAACVGDVLSQLSLSMSGGKRQNGGGGEAGILLFLTRSF